MQTVPVQADNAPGMYPALRPDVTALPSESMVSPRPVGFIAAAPMPRHLLSRVTLPPAM
jgi:hypothetical protein